MIVPALTSWRQVTEGAESKGSHLQVPVRGCCGGPPASAIWDGQQSGQHPQGRWEAAPPPHQLQAQA